MAYESRESTTSLLQRVIDDARELFREEVALARAEVREEASAWAAAGAAMAGGGAVLGAAALFVLVACALGISTGLRWPNWAGFLIVGVVLAVGGGIALVRGRDRARRILMLPRTTESVKETSAWMKNRINSSAR
ncbi:MAG TPA: phage holin family protein [Vicinamibacterales bacterium]|nr:phage holin family protein [Vicinamibacterales bacterium]